MLASSRKAAGHRNAWGNIHFSRSLSFAVMLPGGRDRPPYNARQTAGGIKTPLCGKGHFTGICSRFWHLFPADRRAGVHARRETFRPPRRFRADENHRPLLSTTRQAAPRVGDDARIVPQSCRSPQCFGGEFPFSRRLPFAAMLPGGRDRLPYNARQTAGETGNFAFAADVSFPGTYLRGIVGRAFTPAARPSGNRGVSGPMRSLPPAGGASEAPRRAAPV